MVKIFSDPSQFFSTVAPILSKDETRNSLFYGLARTLVFDPTRYEKFWLGTVNNDDGYLQVAALMTRPYPLVIFSNPLQEQAVCELVDHLLATEVSLPGVNGPEQEAECFSHIWSEKTKRKPILNMNTRAYELTEVLTPPQPIGSMRLAKVDEVKTVRQMLNAMQAEAIPGPAAEFELERVSRLITSETVFVWEMEGLIASMAMKVRPTETSCAIGGVYTWPEKRGSGYATAVVAGLAQVILNEGKRNVTLFTNLSNPISNSIYQKIGFRAICDYQQYDFLDSK